MLARLTRSREQGMDMTTATRPRFGHLRCVAHRLLAVCAWLVELTGCCLALDGGRLAAAPPATPGAVEYPAVKLRGYGVVAGTFTDAEIDGQSLGCCGSSARTREGETRPGEVSFRPATAARRGKRWSALGLRGQGPGFRRCGQVRGDGLDPGRANHRRLEKTDRPRTCRQHGPVSPTPEIRVPMYLDRWDKYGFRFYYGPFVKPQDANHRDVAAYDPRQDFAFAKQSGNVGLVVWNSPFGVPTANGVLDFNSRDWVFNAARQLKLPMGVNIGLEANNPCLANRYPNDMVPNAEQYLGGWYGAINFGIGGTVAWSSDAVQDVALGQLQPLVRRLNGEDTVVNWLEPHEEMCHGVCDVLDDHGPNARRNFHCFLQTRYKTPEAVAVRWRQPGAFKKWDDVPFPEFATFLGWNESAIDLTGLWKISFDAPYDARSAAAGLDDSAWASVPAPGHAIVRALPRKPAVFRRHLRIGPAWRAAHRRVWLYLLDLNDTRGETQRQPRPRLRQRQGNPRESPVPRRIALGHAGGDLRADQRRQPHHGLSATGAVRLPRLSLRRSAPRLSGPRAAAQRDVGRLLRLDRLVARSGGPPRRADDPPGRSRPPHHAHVARRLHGPHQASRRGLRRHLPRHRRHGRLLGRHAPDDDPEHGTPQRLRAGQRRRRPGRFQTFHGPLEHRGHPRHRLLPARRRHPLEARREGLLLQDASPLAPHRKVPRPAGGAGGDEQRPQSPALRAFPGTATRCGRTWSSETVSGS